MSLDEARAQYDRSVSDKGAIYQELNRVALRDAYVQGQISQGVSEADAMASFDSTVGEKKRLSEIEEVLGSTVIQSALARSPSPGSEAPSDRHDAE